jgi:hypothetical protein
MYRQQHEDEDRDDVFEVDDKTQRAQKFAQKQRYKKRLKNNQFKRCPGCYKKSCDNCSEF